MLQLPFERKLYSYYRHNRIFGKAFPEKPWRVSRRALGVDMPLAAG